LIHHSDRGVQYASRAFQRLLKAYGIEGNMSRKGECWDNAVVESFFGSLKSKRIYWRSYQARDEARRNIIDYVDPSVTSKFRKTRDKAPCPAVREWPDDGFVAGFWT